MPNKSNAVAPNSYFSLHHVLDLWQGALKCKILHNLTEMYLD